MVNALSCLVGVQFSLVSSQPLEYGLARGVVQSATPKCVPSTEEIEIQHCVPTAAPVCTTEDVVSEEITYEKRCKEVVSRTCSPVKREANLVMPQAVAKRTIETPCAEHTTEHCVDVPIIKEVVTPVETCHTVTRVACTPAVHSIPKVTCEPGTAEIVHHVPAAVGYSAAGTAPVVETTN